MYWGNIAYVISFVLFALNKPPFSYWPFILPGLAITVAGCDLGYLVCNMYVMLSMPSSQQSLAGSLLQMITRLSVTISFGISTAIFNNVQARPSKTGYYANNPGEPYSMVFWYCLGCSVVCVALCPFLTINTQGNAATEVEDGQREAVEGGIELAGTELAQSQQVPDGKTMAVVAAEMEHGSKDKVI